MPIAYTDTVTDTKVDNIALDRNRRACIRSLVAIRESQRDGHYRTFPTYYPELL
jgi:hypothetical protein